MSATDKIAQNVMYANRYQQVKKLGQGSFGTAYLVQDTQSRPEHDRKVLKSIFIGDISAEESSDAEHEASILAGLRHPNIVRFYDSFIDGVEFCIVTEYCEDGDLDQYLKSLRKQRSRLEMNQVIDLFVQLLSAIKFIHGKKILHRDFGISRFMMNTLDKASTFIGTPFYMSPETLKYDGYNMKSDIWSMGCVFYELSVCKRAYERSNIIQTMQAILHDDPPMLPERFPVKVQQLYLQMLSKDPEKRLTASKLFEEFNQVERKTTTTAQKLTTQSSTPDPESKSLRPDLQRSFSNSPLINKHVRNSLQVPDSPIHPSSSVDSVDSADSQPAGSDDQNLDTNKFDPFSSTAKELKTDFCRNKAQELVGSENFNKIYNFLHDEHKKQFEDPARTDDIVLSGLETISSNKYACTLINELVLHECVNELNDRSQMS